MKGAPAIRSDVPGDHDAIASLLDRTLGAHPTPARRALWEWRHDRNPARSDTIPRFLVAEQGGAVVGAHGLLPLRLQLGERVVTAACSCDFVVDTSARGAGMQLKLRAMSREFAPIHVSTSANVAANRITVALGGREIESARESFLLPLRVSGLARRVLSRKFGKLGGAAATVAAVADAPVAWWRGRSARTNSGEIEVDRITEFGAEFDALWDRARAMGEVLVVRDASYVAWRYGSYPFDGITVLAARRRQELVGFAALHRWRDEDRLTFAALLDLIVDFGVPEAREALLRAAIHHAVAAGGHYIAAKASEPLLRDALKNAGFVARSTARSPYTYKAADAELGTVAAASSWYIALGDGDLCFFLPDQA